MSLFIFSIIGCVFPPLSAFFSSEKQPRMDYVLRLNIQQINGDSFSFAEENEFLNEADLHVFQIL